MNTNSKIKTRDFRATSITWNDCIYTKRCAEDFCAFVCWLVGPDEFTITIEKKEFKVVIRQEASNYIALVPQFVDDKDPVFSCSSRVSREEALTGLAEQISERLLAEEI